MTFSFTGDKLVIMRQEGVKVLPDKQKTAGVAKFIVIESLMGEEESLQRIIRSVALFGIMGSRKEMFK